MVKAIYEHGHVKLIEPAPGRWSEGQSLVVSEQAGAEVDAVRRQFEQLSAQWRAATSHQSDTDLVVNHPAYRRIIGLGPAVVPLLIEDMRRNREHWFVALEAITGERPTNDAMAGKIDQLVRCWVDWYEARRAREQRHA